MVLTLLDVEALSLFDVGLGDEVVVDGFLDLG